MNNFTFSPVATIASCFKDKFTIPRQPGLVTAVTAEVVLLKPYATPEIVRGLEGYSHLWIIFAFHAIPLGQWRPTVRPPRLQGKQRLGVFATRSTHRPNPIGLSVVKLLDIQIQDGDVRLILEGCDLLDGTPVLDIKPYLPYADAISDARGGFASSIPDKRLRVEFSEQAAVECEVISQALSKDIALLIRQLLEMDPRPHYQMGKVGDRVYATQLYDFNLRWRYLQPEVVEVIELSSELPSKDF